MAGTLRATRLGVYFFQKPLVAPQACDRPGPAWRPPRHNHAGPFISPLPPLSVPSGTGLHRKAVSCICFEMVDPDPELEHLLKAERLAFNRYDELRGYPGDVQGQP